MNRINRFFQELQRRNVIKACISYLVISWVILQVAALLSDILDAPDWIGKTLFVVLLIFFPVWILISWYYEFTSEGIKKTSEVPEEASETKITGKKLNILIISFLSLAVILLFVDRFRLQKQQQVEIEALAQSEIPENSIVVLPFTDLSPNKDQEYFADGLAEELLSSLTRLPELKVTSRTSAFSFKNKAIDIPTLAEQLGVNYIVEGSVRVADSIIRITIQLIDSRADQGIWSQTWNKKLENIFEVQNSITMAVVNNLKLQFNAPLLGNKNQTDPRAYALYLEGKHWYQNPNLLAENFEKAKTLVEQSIAIDALYAPAWVLLAKIYDLQTSSRFIAFEEGYPKIKEAVNTALELDPENALVFTTLADIAWQYDWDFQKASEYNQKALMLEPNNDVVFDQAASLAIVLGNTDSAVAYNKRSAELDPVNIDNWYNLGNSYYYNQQYELAIAAHNKALTIEPDIYAAQYSIGLNYLMLGEADKAQEAIAKESDTLWQEHFNTLLLYRQGKKAQAQQALDAFIEQYEGYADYQIAQTYAYWGATDLAFAWLENAYESQDFGMVEMISEPLLNGLHQDPRWDTFLKKVGLKS
ncbi:tetratricopeptide repeat protein [Gilvibacter sediminis]|uniref:tetratricopeptide repeat protein n=1 Tax=Gilvibacter sediminis TaxID=379071 RepID=UPI002350ADB1|nr:hypothetical protein [Gilvibacter sediminis]MDC7997309.1 hypothetical protein [Gilvibacter sediminis]